MSATAYNPTRTERAILELLHGYFCRTNKQWALVDQKWMLNKLDLWQGVVVSRATLCRALAKLRLHGLIESKRRHWRRRTPGKGMGKFQPRRSMYTFCKGMQQFFHKAAGYFSRVKWVPALPGIPFRVGAAAAAGIEKQRENIKAKINHEAEIAADRRRLEAMDPEEARKKLFELRQRL